VVTSSESSRTLAERIRRRGLQGAAARALQRALRIPLTFVATRVLRRRIRRISSIDDGLDVAYGFSFAGIQFSPWQERSEIDGLLRMVAAIEPTTVLEIGTSNGGSLFLFARVAAADALLVSVDLPHGEFGGGYAPWRSVLYRGFASRQQRIRLLRADSHETRTLEAARAALEGRQVDVLFIDGDHTYEGVRRDFEMYKSLVRDGGVIAFHDIVPPSPDGPTPKGDAALLGGEVHEFWAEIRGDHDVSEFVEDWGSGRFGIGAITFARTRDRALSEALDEGSRPDTARTGEAVRDRPASS
jgi:predicted O-methyltransferase YrrM